VAALRDAGWRVAVSARRPEAAAELGVDAVAWPPDRTASLIVNATPLGQHETSVPGTDVSVAVDTTALGLGVTVVDLAYRGDGAETPLCAIARERGARVIDGLDVLVGQGIHAFELLTGRPAPIEAMRRGARSG
jgi:shikimate 5-dehydrogenase